MNSGLLAAAKLIADQLAELEVRRQRIALDGLAALEREDPETANLAIQALEDRDTAADWLTESIQSLGYVTPWQCISEGNVDRVRYVLNAIEYGVYV